MSMGDQSLDHDKVEAVLMIIILIIIIILIQFFRFLGYLVRCISCNRVGVLFKRGEDSGLPNIVFGVYLGGV